MNIKTYLPIGLLWLCIFSNAYALGDNPCQIEKTWSNIKSTQEVNAKQTNLTLDLDISTIRLGKPFSLNVKLCNEKNVDNDTVKPDRITADAIMPAHQHGMNYTPKINYNDDSKHYKISGFLFHMPGLWEITISSYQANLVTHYTKVITLK